MFRGGIVVSQNTMTIVSLDTFNGNETRTSAGKFVEKLRVEHVTSCSCWADKAGNNWNRF